MSGVESGFGGKAESHLGAVRAAFVKVCPPACAAPPSRAGIRKPSQTRKSGLVRDEGLTLRGECYRRVALIVITDEPELDWLLPVA